MSTSPDSQPPVIFISTDGGYEVFALDARLLDAVDAPEERDQLIGALTEARSRGESGFCFQTNFCPSSVMTRILMLS